MARRTVDIIGYILIVCLTLVMAVMLFNPASRDAMKNVAALMSGKSIVETPRNQQPADEFTSYFERFQIPVGNRTYTYFWFEPEKPWPATTKFPLVLVLHDRAGRADAAKFIIDKDVSRKYPAFVVVPVLAPGRYWALPSADDELDAHHALDDVTEIIKHIAAIYPVDMARLYVTGCSDGGTGVYGAARYYPDLFAAGVAVSGTWDPADGVNMMAMPLWGLHGRRDNVIPAENARVLNKIIRSRGGGAHYTEFADMGHECSAPYLYTEKVWGWLFSQKR